MAPMQCTAVVDAPIEKVFATYADFPNAAENVEGIVRIEMLTDGPVGLGTRFKETRVMFGKESTEEMEVTAFEANRMYTLSADSCGARFDSKFTFGSEAGKTKVQMELQTKAITLFAKLMTPVGFLMKGTMKKMIMADIEQVKSVCER